MTKLPQNSVPVSVGAFLALVLVGCGTPKARTLSEARLSASETKMSQLEERLAALEEKASKIDGVAEGVQILLEKLDSVQGGQQERTAPSSTATYSMPIDGDPYLGPKYAKVTLVKGYDFYCGYCDKVRPALAELQTIYGKDLKIVFKNFVIHDDYARLPALAACAAHKQDRFTQMFEAIWVQGIRARQELTEDKLLNIANTLKLNKKRFKSDMYGSCEEIVSADSAAMVAVGARGTPAFFINGRFLSGALPVARYRKVIDEELAKANRALQSGVKLKDYYQQVVVQNGKTSL